ncbi:hypothetical protein O0I10_000687 [Lichtheimia ornata]|uniref:Uncharacterized protein n=1 Tax=Lichtheimia ornata TaxID=688661 RepID=A0AAD7Y446_9FUNG|nr:uncharacterized protein O0I10_000687 [Lichtheimia ornata]KAJ8663448.1 hypothetical protein O0I10_000687 [Lichtheimia ornata]
MFTRRILELLYEDDEELERLEHIRHINELLDSETIPGRGGSHLVEDASECPSGYSCNPEEMKRYSDEYLRVAESTALESLIKFCENLNTIFGDKYLRQPNSMTSNGCSQKMQQGDFLECLAPLTVCIGNGTIALLLGMVLTQVAQSMQARF